MLEVSAINTFHTPQQSINAAAGKNTADQLTAEIVGRSENQNITDLIQKFTADHLPPSTMVANTGFFKTSPKSPGTSRKKDAVRWPFVTKTLKLKALHCYPHDAFTLG